MKELSTKVKNAQEDFSLLGHPFYVMFNVNCQQKIEYKSYVLIKIFIMSIQTFLESYHENKIFYQSSEIPLKF